MVESLSHRQLEALRADADRFIAELDEEAYLHYAGHKETYDLVPIYERHGELTKLETAQALGASVNGGRNVRELWRFACEGYLGNFVREESERVAELEAKLTATVDGKEIAYRNLRPAIMNEDDRGARERLEIARVELTEEHMNPLYLRSAQVVHRETERLGAPNYTELYRGFQFPLDDLADQCRRFLDSTERLWEDAADRFFREPDRPGARRDRALGRRARLARRHAGTRSSRRRRWCPRSRRASPTSASTCARSKTSSSTSRTGRARARARSASRSRSPAASSS